MRVATDFDQTDGQRLAGKIGLSVDVLRISKSNTCNELFSPGSAQGERWHPGQKSVYSTHAHNGLFDNTG